MRGIRKMKMERRRIPIYLLLIGVFMVGLLAFRWGMMSEADGTFFVINGTPVQSEKIDLDRKDSKLQIKVGEEIKEINDSDLQILDGNDKISFKNGTLSACKQGTAIIYYSNNGITCQVEVNVGFTIYAVNGNKDPIEDTTPAIILAAKQSGDTDNKLNGILCSEQLDIITGNNKAYKWESGNTSIVELKQRDSSGNLASLNDGKMTSDDNVIIAEAHQAGYTKITASYIENGKTKSTSIDVYVMPRILNCKDKKYSAPGVITDQNDPTNTFTVHKGDFLSTDFNVPDNENIMNIMSWTISESNSTEKPFVTSDFEDADKYLEQVNKRNGTLGNQFKVNAKAGDYVIKFYPVKDYTKWKSAACAPTTISLKVLPEDIDGQSIELSVGDQFNVLEALNVNDDDVTVSVKIVSTDDGRESNLDNKVTFIKSSNNNKLITVEENCDDKYVKLIVSDNNKGIRFDEAQTKSMCELKLRIVEKQVLYFQNMKIPLGEEPVDLPVNDWYLNYPYDWTVENDKKSNEYIDIIDNKQIRAKMTGNTKLTLSVTMPSGMVKRATLEVTIANNAATVEFDRKNNLIQKGEEVYINPIFKDKDGNTLPMKKDDVKWSIAEGEKYIDLKQEETKALITGKETGSATLLVVDKEGYTIGMYKVKVEEPVTGLSIYWGDENVSEKGEITVPKNRQFINFTASITPNNLTEKDIVLNWKSSNKDVLGDPDSKDGTNSQKHDGLFLLRGAGKTRVTVCSASDSTVFAEVTVIVTDDTNEIKLNTDVVTINVGESIPAISYTVKPETAKPTLKWYSMDPSIAKVDETTGEITGVAVGTTNLLVVTSDGKKAECVINVKQPTEAIKFIQPEITISKGSTLPLMDSTILQMTPADTTERPTWNSFEPGIASVDKNGVVTAVEAGTTYITAAIVNKNGELLTESIKINVVDAPSGISIDQEEYIVDVAGTVELTYHLTPSNATTNVKWRSLDESIAKVDETTGVVTGVKVGWTYVVASSEDGCYDTCIIYVRKQATGVDIIKDEEEVELGKSKQILYSLAPDIEATGSLSWNCSDTSIATVDANGVVTGVKIGTAFIVVTGIDSTGKVYSDTCRIKVVQAATNIVLEQEVYTVEVKGTKQITYHFEPTLESSAVLSWGVLDSTIATVDEKGVVTGVKIGTTYVYVNGTDPNGNIFSKSCRIDVVQMATGMKLDSEKYAVEVGKEQQIGYTLEPNKDSYMALSWSVIDPNVAKVDDKGVVTGVNVGTTHVIVTGLGVSATCTIEVYQNAETLNFTNPSLTVDVGESIEAAYTLVPATATKHTLNWSSQNSTIASVDANGKITGVSKGVTTVFANLPNGNVSYLTVNVISKAKGLQLDPASTELVKGKTLKIKPVFTPEDATNKKVKWASSNESVATIDENGKVTALAGGITMITGISEDGNFSASSMITVVEAVTSVKLNHTSYKLVKGKSVTLKATVDSNTATNSKVKWTTSNKKIATVSQSGKVTGKNIGTCTIKVTAKDGSKRSASCKIRVIRVAKGLEINKTYIRVMEGTRAKLKTKFRPANASIKSLKWETSDAAIATITSKGIITGVTPGMCTVTAKTTDGSNIKVSCTVNVYERVPSTGVTVAASDLIIVKGMTQSAGVTVSPANTTDKLRYSSDHKSIATVSSKGKIKAIKPGNATITVSTSGGQEAYISVTVVDLNKTSLTMEQYDAEDLWVEGIDQNVKWSSSNPAVARVENGSVVARRVGNCTITASLDGVKLYCKVRVNRIRRR